MKKKLILTVNIIILTSILISACATVQNPTNDSLPTNTQTKEVKVVEPTSTDTVWPTNTQIPPTATSQPTSTPTEVMDPNYRIREKDQS